MVGALFVAWLESDPEQQEEKQIGPQVTVRVVTESAQPDARCQEEMAQIGKEVSRLDAWITKLSAVADRSSRLGQCLDEAAERLFFLRQRFDRSADHPDELEGDDSLINDVE